jgi:hypothetical protein
MAAPGPGRDLEGFCPKACGTILACFVAAVGGFAVHAVAVLNVLRGAA